MDNDPIIQVDTSLAKQIAQIIVAEIKTSLSSNDRVYKLAKRCENQTNQVTKWMALNKTCNSPWENASDYFIPLTEWVVDAVHARVMQTLFSQEPFMTAHGVEANDVPKENGVTDFVDMAFREIVHVYDNTKFFWKQMIKLPFAVLKYPWANEYDSMIVKETAHNFVNPATGEQQQLLVSDPNHMTAMAEMMANGYQDAGQEDVWAQEDKELYNQPKLDYVRFEDYAWSANAKRGTRLYWEGNRDWFTINEMMLKVKQEKFRPDEVNKIKQGETFASLTGNDRIIAERSRPVESFHWYGRLPFNKANDIDFTDADAIEQEIYALVGYKDEELLQIMHWPHKRLPWPDRVYIRGEFEETEEFEGRSLVQKLYMTQKELNDLWNNMMNNAWIAMMKIFVKKRTLQGEDWEQPEVYPGAIWEEDMQGDIRALEVGDVKAIALELTNMIISFAERISNISLYQTGTARQEGQKTKGEVELTVAEGNIGLDNFVRNCHNILRKLCQWTISYYAERMPEGLERRIRGENDQTVFPTPENMMMYNQRGIEPYWKGDDLTGKFDFIWNGTSLNADKTYQIQLANDLQQRYLPHPMIAGSLMATWEILKRGLVARGIKDWQKILPPREAILQEMGMMQQRSQIEQQRNAMPSAESRAVEKLGRRGVSREEAVKMVGEKANARQPI